MDGPGETRTIFYIKDMMSDDLTDVINKVRSTDYSNKMVPVFFRNRPELLDELRLFTCDVTVDEKKEVMQRLYHFINEIRSVPICPICETNPKKFRDFTKGYYKTCGDSQCAKCHNKKTGDQTRLKKYGDTCFFRTGEFKQKYKNALGVDNAFQLESVKQKIKQTNLERYGVDHPMKNKEISDRAHAKLRNNNIKIIDEKIGGLDFNVDIIRTDSFGEYTVFCKDCKNSSTLLNSYFNYRMRNGIKPCLSCVPIERYVSRTHAEVFDFIKTISDEVPKVNERQTLKLSNGKFAEMDLYYPESNIGIEINGIFYHGELFKHRMYHQEKKIAAMESGIKLISIWQDYWDDPIKQSIIKSRLLYIFGKIPKRLYARKLRILNVSHQDCKLFLESNHLQGFVKSSIRFGLFDGNELLSVMTFSKEKNGYKLQRFCNKLNTTVVGGADKLFKHFLRNSDGLPIVTYAAMDWSDGGLYEKLDFVKSGITPPSYWWIIKNERKNRFSLRKSELVKRGANPDKSERDIMYEQRSWRIYDCGNLRYVYG